MGHRDQDRDKTPVKKRRWVPDRDTMIFFFFLILSFFFWFLNNLSKDVHTVVSYPVRYVNPPTDRVQKGELPGRLNLVVRGSGYSLLQLRMSGGRSPAIVDMTRTRHLMKPVGESDVSYLLTDDLSDIFSRQLRADFDIVTIEPDTLFFHFDEIMSAMVPVVPDIVITTDRHYRVRGAPMADPDSVMVTGPRNIVDTLSKIFTVTREMSGVNRTTDVTLQLAVDGSLSVNPRRVSVNIPVEQFTEARLNLEVEIINNREGIVVRMFPPEVTATILVALSDYNRLQESNVRAVVDLESIDLHGVDKLPVQIVNLPSYVEVVRHTPRELDFLIENRDLN